MPAATDDRLAALAAAATTCMFSSAVSWPNDLLALRDVRGPRATRALGRSLVTSGRPAGPCPTFVFASPTAARRSSVFLPAPLCPMTAADAVGGHGDGGAVDDHRCGRSRCDVDELQHDQASSRTSAAAAVAEVHLLHHRVGLNLFDAASAMTLPRASTVTEGREGPHEVMSCSTTTTVRSAPMRRNRFPVSRVPRGSCRPRGSSKQEDVGVLHQQHADLEPLLLAVRQDAGLAVAQVGQPIVARASSICGRTFLRRRSSVSADRPAPAAMSRFCRTVRSSNTDAVWKVRPTPERAILVDLLPQQFDTGLGDRTGGRHQAGDGVTSVGLAGAVGPDEEGRSPWNSFRSTPSTAVKPSNVTADRESRVLAGHSGVAAEGGLGFGHRATSSSRADSGSLSRGAARRRVRRAGQPRDAGREEADDDDEQQALRVRPRRRKVLRQGGLPRDNRSRRAPPEQGGAATDRHPE